MANAEIPRIIIYSLICRLIARAGKKNEQVTTAKDLVKLRGS